MYENNRNKMFINEAYKLLPFNYEFYHETYWNNNAFLQTPSLMRFMHTEKIFIFISNKNQTQQGL